MSESPAPITPPIDVAPRQESIISETNNITARETEQLVNEMLDIRAEEVFNEIQTMSSEEQTATLKDGTPESALHLYHKINNLKPSNEPLKNPINLAGSPIVLYADGNSYSTLDGANAQQFKITSIVGADTNNGQLMADCWIEDIGTEPGRATKVKKISIPVSVLKNAQVISEKNAILADPKLTESQKKLIQTNNKAKTDGAANVDYSTVKPAIKEVAETQGKLLAEPLVQVLTIHKNQPLAEGATPEQQLRHQQKMEKIDKALEQIQGSTIATPEAYAAVFSALGPTDIENVIASADATLATDRMTLKNLESQNPPNQQLIAEQKTKIQQEEASQEQRKKSLELFNDQEKLTKYISSIQSGEMKPEVAKKINELMAQGDFRGGVAAMVENKFNQLDDETKKKVLEGLKKFGKNIASYGAAGLAIALMVMIVEGLKPQQ